MLQEYIMVKICECICKLSTALYFCSITEYSPVSENLGVPVVQASTYTSKLCYFYKEIGG